MSIDLIRLAPGIVSLTTLTTTDSYLVQNFPIQADQVSPIQWVAGRSQGINDGTLIRGLDGSGGLNGFASGDLTFFILTQNMLDYLFDTVLDGQYVNDVTLYLPHPKAGMQAYTAKMIFPTDVQASGERYGQVYYANVVFRWDNGTVLS